MQNTDSVDKAAQTQLLEVPVAVRPPLSRTVTSTVGPGERSEVLLQAKKNTILTSHGRPPWYGADGNHLSDAFVIGIAGEYSVVFLVIHVPITPQAGLRAARFAAQRRPVPRDSYRDYLTCFVARA